MSIRVMTTKHILYYRRDTDRKEPMRRHPMHLPGYDGEFAVLDNKPTGTVLYVRQVRGGFYEAEAYETGTAVMRGHVNRCFSEAEVLLWFKKLLGTLPETEEHKAEREEEQRRQLWEAFGGNTESKGVNGGKVSDVVRVGQMALLGEEEFMQRFSTYYNEHVYEGLTVKLMANLIWPDRAWDRSKVRLSDNEGLTPAIEKRLNGYSLYWVERESELRMAKHAAGLLPMVHRDTATEFYRLYKIVLRDQAEAAGWPKHEIDKL